MMQITSLSSSNEIYITIQISSNSEIVGITRISRRNGQIKGRHVARGCMPCNTKLEEHLAPKWPSVILLECMQISGKWLVHGLAWVKLAMACTMCQVP